MKSTVVPFRNGIFLSIAIGYAESIKAEVVSTGVHQGDHTIYPDCRPTFIQSIHEAAQYGCWQAPSVTAPLLYMNKKQIVGLGLELEAPISRSWTCYKGEEEPCGVCGSCVERAEAFADHGIKEIYLKKGSKNASN